MNLLKKMPVYYGWWVLASSALIMYCSGNLLFGFPAFYPSFIQTFGWSRTQVLIGGSIWLGSFGIAQFLWGSLADKLGGVRVVLILGTTFVTLAQFLCGQMSQLWQFYAIQVLFGAGLAGMSYLPNQILQSRWFVRRRGLAISIVGCASALGGMVGASLVTYLISRIGWQSTMTWLSVLVWIVPFLVIILVIKERPGIEDQESSELSVADKAEIKKDSVLAFEGMEHFRTAFLSPVFCVIIAIAFFSGGTVSTTLQLLIVYLRDVGFSPQIAATVLSFEVGLSFVGRLIFGPLSDRFGVRPLGIVGYVFLGLSPLLLLLITRSPGIAIAFGLVHGLGHGAVITFQPLMMASTFGTGKYLGRLLASSLLAYNIGMALIPLISSYSFDKTGSYGTGFIMNSVMTLLSALALVLIGSYLKPKAARRMSLQPET
jgi:MFS family permease